MNSGDKNHIISTLNQVKYYVNRRFLAFLMYVDSVKNLTDVEHFRFVHLILGSVNGLGFTLEGAVERIYGQSISNDEWLGSGSTGFRKTRLVQG